MSQQDNKTDKGIRLIQESRRGIFRLIFSRLGLFLLLFAVQIWGYVLIFRWFASFIPEFVSFQVIFALIATLYIVNSDIDVKAKNTYLIIIALAPIFGLGLLFFIESDLGHRIVKRRLDTIGFETKDLIKQDKKVLRELKAEDPGVGNLIHYLAQAGAHPVYNNTDVRYLETGQEKFRLMLEELEKAEEFIFLEYFIIAEGVMWGSVLEKLAEKAKQGVEVRVMYDGTNEYNSLTPQYHRKLSELGIKTSVFSPLTPILSTYYNYRDHRKILVIDGKVSFTGGINLADEYIGLKDKFGKWKDCAIMLRGEAVKSMTLQFLQLWAATGNDTAFEKYLHYPGDVKQSEGYVAPYGDSPLDELQVGKMVLMDMLYRAKRYVHIKTPYLILDSELENALIYASGRGLDVSIIMPGIPDKKVPYALAKTHYAKLIKAGVRIYEFKEGFVHSKVFVSDDQEAVVGTINLDYRSLYHHFENAVYLYKKNCVADIEADFKKTLLECRKVHLHSIWTGYTYLRPVGFFAQAIAPLL